MGKNGIELKRIIETKEVIAYLEALVESMKKGCIVLEQGENTVSLNPPLVVNLEIEARQKKDKEKFAFEISWKGPEIKDAQQDIRISSAPQGHQGGVA